MVGSVVVKSQQAFAAVHVARCRIHGKFQSTLTGANIPTAGRTIGSFDAKLAARRGVMGRSHIHGTTNGNVVLILEPETGICARHGCRRTPLILADGRGHLSIAHGGRAACLRRRGRSSGDDIRSSAVLGARYGRLSEGGIIVECARLASENVCLGLTIGRRVRRCNRAGVIASFNTYGSLDISRGRGRVDGC